MSLVLFFAAQHVSNASTLIFRSLQLCVGILLWFDVCWRYGVVRLGWCGSASMDALPANQTRQPSRSHETYQHTSNQSSIPTHSCKLLKMNVITFETC